MRRPLAVALALALACWPITSVQAQPPRDKQRRNLMDQLGMPKKKPEPEQKPKDEPNDESKQKPNEDRGDGPSEGPGESPDGDPGGSAPSSGTTTRRLTFAGTVQRLLDANCKSCHATGASAGGTRYSISGDFEADYANARRLVDRSKPARSILLTKAAGEAHGGGANFPVGSTNYATLLEWIEGGALKGGAAGAAPAPTPKPAPEADKPTQPTGPGAAPGKPGTSGSKPPTQAAMGKGPEAEPELEPGVGSELDPEQLDAAVIVYAPDSHAILQAKCASCHAVGSFADEPFGLTGDPDQDYFLVRDYVDLGDPEASALLSKGRGERHSGGASLAVPSPEYAELLAWIEAGALGPTAADVRTVAVAGEPGEGVEIDATTSASPRAAAEPGHRLGDGTPVPESTGSRLPFSLPYHLRLNGRFDLSYERRDYKNHPFGPGRNALATYHHFLFLSRSGADDPFGFNIELLTQQFFEFNARFVTHNKRAKFLLKAGKIMVPFGDEPLFHTSYGGRAGFDQELMPVIWSQPGLAVNAHIRAGPVSISNDTYAVQGYRLRTPEAVLNLQSDFSSFDDFQFAVGNRLGLSWAPLSAWYSFQVNPLGHGRTLFMQAFDLEFWRLPDVPFLQDIVVGLGAMRADVSGGGPGLDYYHFGSYGKVRYYPVDWFYIQYRWGLKTFDNRRGLYFDDTRMDERDNSSHNLSIGATWKGIYATLQLFWNLEKANEQDNDFLRFTVGYAF